MRKCMINMKTEVVLTIFKEKSVYRDAVLE